MEPTGAEKATLLTDAKKMLLCRIPLKASMQDVVDVQLSSVNDGLQYFHTGEYHKAIELFHMANGMQENNLILFVLSFTYYLIADYGNARTYADRIDASYFGSGLIPEITDVENLYLLIDAQAAGWEEKEDNYRKNGPPKIYIPSDLLQFKQYYLEQAANIAATARESDKKLQ